MSVVKSGQDLCRAPSDTCQVCLPSAKSPGCSGVLKPGCTHLNFGVVVDIPARFDVVLLCGAEHCSLYPQWRQLHAPEWNACPLHLGMLFDGCCVYTQSRVYFLGLGDGCWQSAQQQDGKKRAILCSSAISTLSLQGKLLVQGFSFFSTNVILGFAANLGDWV